MKRCAPARCIRALMRPNSYQTRSDLWYNTVKMLMMEGNAYITGKRNDRNEIVELHQLPSRGTMPYVDPDTKQVFYAAGDNPLLGDISVMIPARDMCHIRLFCPRHPLVGVSPLVNAAASAVTNASISQHQARFFENMSRPSGILSSEMTLTKEQMLQLRAAWNEQSKDMNTGGVPILGGGLRWQSMSLSNNDAEIVSTFQMTVEDVARAFRVPLPLVNDNRHATYNNVEQLIAHWLSGGLGFILDHVENSIDKFYGLPTTEKVEFETDVLMRTDFQARVDAYSKLCQNGILSVNEGRARMSGLKPVENGDKPMVQQQMVPLGWTESQPAPVPPAPPELEPAPEPDPEERAGATIHYLKSVLNG